MIDSFFDWLVAWRDRRRLQKYLATADTVREKADNCALTDADLIYAADTHCICGAGLAYPKGIGAQGFWDCSDILTGRAIPKDQPGNKQHCARYPFIFYEIKSENQPSANGATTRRKA